MKKNKRADYLIGSFVLKLVLEEDNEFS